MPLDSSARSPGAQVADAILNRDPWSAAADRKPEETPTQNNIPALAYLPLVRAVAGRIYQSLPAGVPVELNDLVQAGMVGLLHAAKAYDPGLGVAFPLYARYRVRGEIVDTLRELDLASRKLRRAGKRMQSASRKLVTQLGREPTEEEVARELALDAGEAREQTAALARVRSALVAREDITNVRGAPDSRPDSICGRRERQRVLSRAVGNLPQRHRRLISLYYAAEMNMQAIGRALSVTEGRVSQMHKDALQALGSALQALGIRCCADV